MIFCVGRKESYGKFLTCSICKKTELDYVFIFDCGEVSFEACEQCCIGLEQTLKLRHWALGIYPKESNS